ncbi:alpha-glucosidase/alpha-galactosidase [Butyrivibrio sp. MC2013]|uniref:alpha-glucosidase/alpha-galactosidase n=1 Tax=Butyrivibrio sp. MC2013 TaxID=1280686 RepID=UPI000410FEFF|nr:alpha-glucosidase/alpha-galactosidase [Butyrivibrio sp. MC2013]
MSPKLKITLMGAGSTVFTKNVAGDVLSTPALKDCEIALYDIDGKRLEESYRLITTLNKNVNDGKAVISSYLGPNKRKDALRDATFVVNTIQVGGYDPCTIIDFEIPKKYGIRQTIADTMGIGGIMRALRTIPVMEDFTRDMEEVCPNALFMNYTNPMAMLTGYVSRYSSIKTVGLCHSVQCCSHGLLSALDMEDKLEGRKELIAGINHMAWLLSIQDKYGNDLYPEIKRRAAEKNKTKKHNDMVRYDYIDKLGYYCTESSEHNAEYNPFYIKEKYPELIDEFNIPLDEYPRRCINQIKDWESRSNELLSDNKLSHERSGEYASYIMEAVVTGKPYSIGGNVLNTGHLIADFPENACVEVPCLVDAYGIHPTRIGSLPPVLAAMNMTNINAQLLTIEAARTRRKEDILRAIMLEPRCAAALSISDMKKMMDELIEAHGEYMSMYK